MCAKEIIRNPVRTEAELKEFYKNRALLAWKTKRKLARKKAKLEKENSKELVKKKKIFHERMFKAWETRRKNVKKTEAKVKRKWVKRTKEQVFHDRVMAAWVTKRRNKRIAAKKRKAYQEGAKKAWVTKRGMAIA